MFRGEPTGVTLRRGLPFDVFDPPWKVPLGPTVTVLTPLCLGLLRQKSECSRTCFEGYCSFSLRGEWCSEVSTPWKLFSSGEWKLGV